MKIFSVHISSLIRHIATAMLLLWVKIWPRKSSSNLTQLIIFILLNRLFLPINGECVVSPFSVTLQRFSTATEVGRRISFICAETMRSLLIYIYDTFPLSPFRSSALSAGRHRQFWHRRVRFLIFQPKFSPVVSSFLFVHEVLRWNRRGEREAGKHISSWGYLLY